MTAQRRKADFPSAGSRCAAWHYPGENGACVIMAAGLAVIKEAGTDRLARRFHDAGYTVLAFDYRRLGESGGVPRQLVRIGDQLADGTPPSGSLPAFPASTATNSRYGDSRPLADTSPAWLHTTRVLPRRSLTRHLPTESTPCTTRSDTPPRARWLVSPVVLLPTPWAAWLGATRCWYRWPASEAWLHPSPHPTPATALRRSTREIATRSGNKTLPRGRRSVLASTGPADSLADSLPPPRCCLRGGRRRAAAAGDPRCATGPSRPACPPARRALHGIPRWRATGRTSHAGLSRPRTEAI